MLRSRANEIQKLVQRLGSRSPSLVESAQARLSIVGARAVEQLIAALEGDNNRIRARAMPLLALIQDPRGREPLIAMLLDRNARLREIAARCLGRFPSADAVAALNRALKRERTTKVRVAAVHALVEQYAAGQEQAIRLLLPLMIDTGEPAELRVASCSLLGALRPAQRRSILARLEADEDDAVRHEAETVACADGGRDAGVDRLPELLADLGAADYPTWNEAVRCLGACGAKVVTPLIDEMRRRQHDPEYCTRAGMALKSLGPRRGKALGEALERVDEPLPLQVLVEVVGAMGEKSLIYRLKGLIDRLGASSPGPVEPGGFDPVRRVRAKAHLELARVGSRVAIVDLREALADPQRRVELEMLSAVELIGKRDELTLLLKAYGREDGFVRERIGRVVRAIMKRERIRRNNAMFRALAADQRKALNRILPPSPSRPRRSRSGPAPRA